MRVHPQMALTTPVRHPTGVLPSQRPREVLVGAASSVCPSLLARHEKGLYSGGHPRSSKARLGMSRGIRHLEIIQTPVAVLDFETTGLDPSRDRVVEVSVVRVDPGERPKLVLDTLINPRCPVKASHIHGITDRDVRSAPTFRDALGEIKAALAGCVVAAYNASFDMRFLRSESERAGHPGEVPYMCLMQLRPLLGLGARCNLAAACAVHRITIQNAHRASVDAMAAAGLVPVCISAIRNRGLRTFDDLSKLGGHAYLRSFELDPWDFDVPRQPSRLLRRGGAGPIERAVPPAIQSTPGEVRTTPAVQQGGLLAWLRRIANVS